MRSVLLIFLTLAILVPLAPAQPNPMFRASIYIAPIAGNLDLQIAAEIVRRNLPVLLTRDRAHADYILSGPEPRQQTAQPAGYSPDLPGTRSDTSVILIDAHNQNVVWAAAANCRAGEPQSRMAAHIVRRLKRDFFVGVSVGERLDQFLHP
jgi:hypothetical protein